MSLAGILGHGLGRLARRAGSTLCFGPSITFRTWACFLLCLSLSLFRHLAWVLLFRLIIRVLYCAGSRSAFFCRFSFLVIPNFPAGELGQGTRGRVSTSEGGSWSPYSSFLLLSLGLGLGFWCLVKHGRLNGKASWRLGIRAVYLAGTGTGSCPTALWSFPYLYLPRKKNENPIFVWGEDISCLSL